MRAFLGGRARADFHHQKVSWETQVSSTDPSARIMGKWGFSIIFYIAMRSQRTEGLRYNLPVATTSQA